MSIPHHVAIISVSAPRIHEALGTGPVPSDAGEQLA